MAVSCVTFLMFLVMIRARYIVRPGALNIYSTRVIPGRWVYKQKETNDQSLPFLAKARWVIRGNLLDKSYIESAAPWTLTMTMTHQFPPHASARNTSSLSRTMQLDTVGASFFLIDLLQSFPFVTGFNLLKIKVSPHPLSWSRTTNFTLKTGPPSTILKASPGSPLRHTHRGKRIVLSF